jgi:membrane protein YqaA with SNARE-associated domain
VNSVTQDQDPAFDPVPAAGPADGGATVPAGSQVRAAGRRRLRWADVVCIGGIVASGLWYLAVIPAIPSLLGTHPVLLEALSGSLPSELAAGAFARVGRASLALALAAPVLGASAFDPFWWWAGRRYGDSVTRTVAERNPRAARGVERGLRLFGRRGGWTLVFAYYLPVPNNVLYAAAGWTGYSFLRFAVLLGYPRHDQPVPGPWPAGGRRRLERPSLRAHRRRPGHRPGGGARPGHRPPDHPVALTRCLTAR